MPTPQCMANIAAEPKPYNRSCSDDFCRKTSFARGVHCDSEHKPVDTPVLSWDTSIPPIGGDDYTCYCCCSCYALNTPIEATPGEFVLIQNINAGDSIMTTGLDLKWKPGIVKERSGDIKTSMVPGLYLVRYQMPGEKNTRDILVTPDHLFLMFTSKTLKKVQNLIPGNKLMTAEGKSADVVFVAHGEYETSIQSINMKEKFNGKDLTGHLINANGIISTDYAVQSYFETGNLDPQFSFKFSNDAAVHDVGTPEYIQNFQSSHLKTFLATPDSWPKGFNPLRKTLVNVPPSAKSFLTADQAADVLEKSEFNAYSNGVPRETANKLFRIFSSEKNNVNYILDWNNDNVNAFSWISGNQNYLLITGGLARVKDMFMDGISLIISDMLTRMFSPLCVAEADYGSFNILRKIFPDAIFAPVAPNGIRQVTKVLFDQVSPKNAAGDPNDVCEDPSIACRKEAFWNGLSFLDMPKCGVPVKQYFYLKSAYAAFDLASVNVQFDNAVNVASAESLINYNIEPGVEITAAKVSENEPGTVVLSVKGLKHESKYVVSVVNVTSVDNQSLGEGAFVAIATP